MHRSNGENTLLAAPRRCPRCEYNLYGLPAASCCPECGWDASLAARRAAAPADAPRRRVARCHLAGLVLLLLALYYGLNVVLIEDTSRGIGGNLPLINVPGPKFWAASTLRRPIGNYISPYGLAGTHALLLSIAAVWLLTVRRPEEQDSRLRLAARYTAAIAGGAAFGLTVGMTGLWSGATTWTRMLMTTVIIEVMTTFLLWLRLRQIAEEVGSPSLRRSAAAMAIVVPALMAVAAALLLWRHSVPAAMWGWNEPGPALGAALMSYGAASIAAAVTATATVVALAGALIPVAFPTRAAATRSLVLRGRRLLEAAVAWRAGDSRSRAVLTMVLLLLLVLVHMMIFARVNAYEPRMGYGGNVPLLNYAGLKIWGTPLTEYGWLEMRFRHFNNWHPALAVNWALLLAAVVAALTAVRRDVAPWLGRAVGWGTLIGIGGLAGASLALTRMEQTEGLDHSRAIAVMMLFLELPLTFLLHRWLARLAIAHGRRRAASRLRVIGWVVAGLQVAGILVLAAARLTGLPLQLEDYRLSLPAMAVCAVYGAISLTVAVAAFSAIASLLAGLAGDAVARVRRAAADAVPATA